ncbi:hypothetical protein GCM10022416_13270 [Actinomadura keratinilytica]|uniref:Inositolphosphotransferase Aur1/Ipt1 domain-containing protein n=2 Tax=Actinomadura keratinilytica TaxID=547461 RepID=A0ABP7YA55_9ACTN
MRAMGSMAESGTDTDDRPELRRSGRALSSRLSEQLAVTALLRALARLTALAFLVVAVLAQLPFWHPEVLFFLLLAVFTLLGEARAYLAHFGPFIGLVVVYDSFRAIADDLSGNVHVHEMIKVDEWLFGGTLPTVWLQSHLWDGQVSWFDYYFYLLYILHFPMPAALALYLWRRRPALYRPFVAGLVVLSFSAFLTYAAFPAAPPWMASEQGDIAPVARIAGDVWASLGVHGYGSIYDRISPNPVAAIPSLHAAYPTLFLLFMGRCFGWRRVWWLGFYPISVWVGIVYFAEHYVIDLILGALYAAAAYKVTMLLFARLRRRRSREPSGGATRQEAATG